MDANSLIFFFAGISISAAIFAALVFFYPQLADRPKAQSADTALLPFLFYGICGAFRTTERAAANGYPLLAGPDKKSVADAVYAVLPAPTGKSAGAIVKDIVSQEQFAQRVQDAFDGFDAFYRDNQDLFDEQYELWQQAHPRQ